MSIYLCYVMQGVHKLVINRTMDEFVSMTSNISNGVGNLGRPSSENCVNGDVGREVLEEIRPLTGSQSPVKCSRNQKGYCEDGIDSRDWRKSSPSGNDGDRHEDMAFSPSHDRYHEKIHSRNKSEPHDRARERSRSQSTVEETSSWKATVLDDGKIVGRRRSRDYRHDSRDLLGDNSRERSSCYNIHDRGLDRHHSREAQDRGREGSRDTWDKDRERREVGRDRKRERGQERERERERNRDMGRERGREKDKEREQERESRREREKERKWERDGGRDRIRGERDNESDRFSRHLNYDNNVDDGDIYDRSEGWRHDETNLRGHKTGKKHTTKMNTMGKDEDKFERSYLSLGEPCNCWVKWDILLSWTDTVSFFWPQR